MPTHIWKGHAIEVQMYASPKALWFGAGLRVRVDSSASFESPDHYEGLHTVVPFEVVDDGAVKSGRVESGRPFSVLHGVYRVFIQDHEVASGAARAENWYITYGILVGMAVAMLSGYLLLR